MVVGYGGEALRPTVLIERIFKLGPCVICDMGAFDGLDYFGAAPLEEGARGLRFLAGHLSGRRGVDSGLYELHMAGWGRCALHMLHTADWSRGGLLSVIDVYFVPIGLSSLNLLRYLTQEMLVIRRTLLRRLVRYIPRRDLFIAKAVVHQLHQHLPVAVRPLSRQSLYAALLLFMAQP